MRGRIVLAAACVITALGVAPVEAHETQTVGPLRLAVGWEDEPALVGAMNAVEVTVTETSGAPVNDPAASLAVEVSFGSQRTTRALALAAGRPGVYAAAVLPTRAGTYALRVHGPVRGVAVDITSTCSDKTFDCVRDAGDVQFPVRDPTNGELAARLDRELARKGDGSSAEPLAIAALAVAVVALGLAGVAFRRGARRS
jgi:hypothetical protein